MGAAFGVGAGLIGEALVVMARFDFRHELSAEVLRLLVFLGREFGQREIAAECVGFHCGGEIPEVAEVLVGVLKGFEAETFLVGQFEHFLLGAASGDDGLAGGVVRDAETAFAFNDADHSFHDIFFEGADRELDGEFLYRCIGQNAFDGADCDVTRAIFIERRDADFAD